MIVTRRIKGAKRILCFACKYSINLFRQRYNNNKDIQSKVKQNLRKKNCQNRTLAWSRIQ